MASYKTRRDRFYQTAVRNAVANALFAAAIAAYLVFTKQPLAIEYADRHYNMGKFGPP